MEIALINDELFKENSPIKDDTIIDSFVPYIGIAQKMYIERILGRPLVDELKAQIKAASVTPAPVPNPITADNQALLLMVAPPLAFYAVYQGIPFHWAAIVNKGITVRNSENSSAVDIKDIAQLRRWLKDDAEELARGLRDYLAGSSQKYPLWSPVDGQGCALKKESVPYDFGIFIPNRR